MSTVTFQGNPVSVSGKFPATGEKVPAFVLCGADLSNIKLNDFAGKKVVLNIFPSIDTPVCATSVRTFNQKAAAKENTVVVCISADLPFAAGRFCEVEGIEGVTSASFFRAPEFTESYGVNINEGPLRGLAARAVICLNEEGLVVHSELVKEITEEPNYQAALDSL
ncbi:thiol peroxidase [Endozoicomonas sp. SM1973]|uniref:Thiol peroxidase n=1 Tax=Spartinivicinus marinus TaxID=2994442 RepID=A0A853HZI9_9GAMM|nr:thiol peroxidase [Spartinivicinus marinus]MCX4025786.1 thiol peroxidase [Spartinivicinus marinus]NYZ65779.1 thiol peroxidase [Spartinivicinus marinus]